MSITNKLRYKLCLLLILPLFAMRAGAQSPVPDKLIADLENASTDTGRLQVTIDIAYYYLSANPDTCFQISQNALQHCLELNFKKGAGWAYMNMGEVAGMESNHSVARGYYLKSLQQFREIGLQKGMAIALHYVGMSYHNQNEYVKALGFYEKSLAIKRKINDQWGVAASLNNMGSIYKVNGDYPRALTLFGESRGIYQKMDNLRGLAACTNNMAGIYKESGQDSAALEFYQQSLELHKKLDNKRAQAAVMNNLGIFYLDKGNLETARQYHQQALDIRQQLKDLNYLSSSLGNLGRVYKESGQWETADSLYRQSLETAHQTSDRLGTANAFLNRAELFLATGRYKKSIEQATLGLQAAQEILALKEVKMLAFTLYKSFKKSEDAEKALQYLELYTATNDSLFNSEKIELLARKQTSLELAEQAREIKLLGIEKALREAELNRQINEKLALEKQAEAGRLRALAQQEKDRRKADSLRHLARNAQLQAEKMSMEQQRTVAENKATSLQLQQAESDSRMLSIIISMVLVLAVVLLLFAIHAFRSWRKESRARQVIQEQHKKIEQMNSNLEVLVAQRTKDLLARNQQLQEYAFYNSHMLRRPIATIMGLFNIIKLEKNLEEKEELFGHLNKTVGELDSVVRKIQHIVDHNEIETPLSRSSGTPSKDGGTHGNGQSSEQKIL